MNRLRYISVCCLFVLMIEIYKFALQVWILPIILCCFSHFLGGKFSCFNFEPDFTVDFVADGR